MIPILAGVHHLKLPVSDLPRSIDWYRTRLGYTVGVEFTEQGVLRGGVLHHPVGGPMLGLRLSPERAAAAAGFDYFSIGVPDRPAIEALARHLESLGESHAGCPPGLARLDPARTTRPGRARNPLLHRRIPHRTRRGQTHHR